jgi:hypothetical protein
MSFSGVENQWQQPGWMRSRSARSLVYFPATSWHRPAASCWCTGWNLRDMTPFIDFGPRIADIPDALMAADYGLQADRVA